MSTPASALPDPLAKDAGFDAMIRQRQAQIDNLDSQVTSRQNAIDTGLTQNAQAKQTALAPLEEAAKSGISEEQKLLEQQPKSEPLPRWQPQPIINEQDFHGLAFGLIGMAMIGGLVSKGNWLGVSASLNGALKGYLDGNQMVADKEFKDYQTKYQEALDRDNQAQKRFEQILNNKNLSIRAQLDQIGLVAAQYDRQDVLLARNQQSLDGIRRQVEASRNALDSLQQRNDSALMSMQLGMDRLKAQAGGMANLDDQGRWFLMSTVANGNTKFEQMLASRYGGQVGAMVVNEMGKLFRDNDLDPANMTEEQLSLMAQKTVQTQASSRLAGVERLTNAIKPLETELGRLITKLNGMGITASNATINSVRKALGDADYSELRTMLGSVGRQYIEAITMPGSNAQLHASAQDWADGTFDQNMNMASLMGTFKAMNMEIESTHKALLGAVERSKQSVIGQGPKIAAPGAAPGPPAVPLDQYLQTTTPPAAP
jgi:hypothetical protein